MDFSDFMGSHRRQVRDARHAALGEVAAVYVDEEGVRVVFVEIEMPGHELHRVVPLERASVSDEEVVLPYDIGMVLKGPSIRPDDTMSGRELHRVERYYKVNVETGRDTSSDPGVAKKKRPRPRHRIPFEKKNLPPAFDRRNLPPVAGPSFTEDEP